MKKLYKIQTGQDTFKAYLTDEGVELERRKWHGFCRITEIIDVTVAEPIVLDFDAIAEELAR